jgi:hypothetical protein
MIFSENRHPLFRIMLENANGRHSPSKTGVNALSPGHSRLRNATFTGTRRNGTQI